MEALGAELKKRYGVTATVIGAGSGVTVTALCPGPPASGFQEKADLHNSAGQGQEVADSTRIAQSIRHACHPPSRGASDTGFKARARL
jgi:short-subunit dehydrogenase